MLGLDNYGSDASDSDNDSPVPVPKEPSKPAVAVRKTKKPVRIAIELPKAAREREDDEDDKPAKKKPRLESGAGRSSLLSMLPAPKVAASAPPKTERVLGGAGSGSGWSVSRPADGAPTADDDAEPRDAATLLVPTAVKKAAAAAKPKAPARDFFSLGSTETTTRDIEPTPSSSSSAVQISSAPAIQEYEPPEPTPLDPYPGYYQMPNGTWGQYEPRYYKTFWDKWQKAAMPDKEEKGFEGVDVDQMQSFSAQDSMARARKEIEESKSVTRNIKSGPTAPNMNIAKAPSKSLANQRHQLSTLLYSAYQNRDALEEKIAEGRRNRKEAGNKYGF
ncbi:hypothetical protein EXIGLDRAFT_837936 [Exidia glandulosa HHB12029]|uniref:Mitotic checkpoint regulator, MAD2B-interacting-domain-containing protein n=1 Tax=Exidia glandulosa HHB12029 TaxID=1314781 RepID=A0A165GAT0_EXIGL|nr:hypothetical protein EXIGLDRAFT_837936 [Exidia glandulosa HHB12029]